MTPNAEQCLEHEDKRVPSLSEECGSDARFFFLNEEFRSRNKKLVLFRHPSRKFAGLSRPTIQKLEKERRGGLKRRNRIRSPAEKKSAPLSTASEDTIDSESNSA